MTDDPNDGRIYPTHSCFDDAMEFFSECFPDPRDVLPVQDRYRIVHALCEWPDPADPRPYAHAWVEETVFGPMTDHGERGVDVWQGGVRFGARVFYAIPYTKHIETRRIVLQTHYTLRQAAELNAKHGTFGPWAPQYIAACRPGATQRGAIETKVTLGRVRIISPAPPPTRPGVPTTRKRKGSR